MSQSTEQWKAGPAPKFSNKFLVNLDDEQRRFLELAAETSGCSMSDVLRHCVGLGINHFSGSVIEMVALAKTEEEDAVDQEET